MSQLIALYEKIVGFLRKLGWLPPLLARIALGVVFAQSGWGKMHNIDKVIGFFNELHLPAPEFQAHLVAYTEFLGGLLVLIGLATRAASIPLSITMIVAITTAKAEEIHEFSDLLGMSEFLFILLFVYLIIEGAGKVSLDYLLDRKIGRGV